MTLAELPVPGAEVERLTKVFELDHGIVDPSARSLKVTEAQRILARGPVATGESAIGLALGFVQSGKTMSFTTLAALAADTGYRIVVLILGNTHLLVDQNTQRLFRDLRLDDRDDFRWAALKLPGAGTDLDFLLDQDDRVVLITVLKNASRIKAVTGMLTRSALTSSLPALVIDDEADQASLNAAVRQGKETATYRAIRRMRAALGPHLYVQYTATPFAPLLLEPHDHLAPEFVELLTPGSGYTGGREFFIERRHEVVRSVSEDEADEKSPSLLPAGLREAVRTFLVGTALLRAVGRAPSPTSMLIHTSGMKFDHRTVARLLQAHLEDLRTSARLPDYDPGKRAWLKQMLPIRETFTSPDVQAVDEESFTHHLADVTRHAKPWEVNSAEDAEQLDWRLSPVNILIGGNKLDRGFTVKGLTTTYITRRARVGQADTIEQRARCYGYKRMYLDECRVFAPADVAQAFTSLVHTEADVRESLLAWSEAGRPLSDWSIEQGILLPDNIRPTRTTVLSDNYDRPIAGWSFLRRPDPDAMEANTRLLDPFGLLVASPDRFGDVILRRVDGSALEDVIDGVLEPWRCKGSAGWDQDRIVDDLRRLRAAGLIEEISLVYLEVAGKHGERARLREWREPDGFVQLMQGRNQGTGYRGDRGIVGRGAQLQVHRVAPKHAPTDETLALALYIPADRGITKGVTRA